LCLVGLVVLWLAANFVEAPAKFVNIALVGHTNGMIFGPVALEYTPVNGIVQLINGAHGDVFALSGLVAWFATVVGLGVGSSIVVAVGGLLVTLLVIMTGFALFNASIERVAYRPLRTAPRLAPASSR